MDRQYNPGIFLLFASVLLLMACGSDAEVNEEDKIVSINDKEAIFTMILAHPDLQQYLHPEVKGRIPLKVKSNEILGVNISVTKFDKPVEFHASSNAAEDAALLEVVAFDVNADKAVFEILYAIEGITIKGALEKHNDQWSFVEFEITES